MGDWQAHTRSTCPTRVALAIRVLWPGAETCRAFSFALDEKRPRRSEASLSGFSKEERQAARENNATLDEAGGDVNPSLHCQCIQVALPENAASCHEIHGQAIPAR